MRARACRSAAVSQTLASLARDTALAMSQETPSDRVRRAYDALKRRDLETFLGFIDPEVEIVPLSSELEGTRYHGHDGARTWWKELLRVFPDFAWDLGRVSDVGHATIAELRVRGQGIDSDVPFAETVWMTTSWRDGKVIAWRTCRTEAEALEAAGLRE